jgi:3-oxoacyl-[acyl-carrier-protein] synthase III
MTAEPIRVYLGCIEYELGELVSLDGLAELKKQEGLVETLNALGLESYALSDRSAAELALTAASRTLRRASVMPRDIDVLVYATSSLSDQYALREGIANLVLEIGLQHAYPMGVFLSGCANFHSALRIARSLVRSGDAAHVLLVTTDKVPDGVSRMVPPNVSVASDGAASCIVSASSDLEFEVMSVCQHVAPDLVRQCNFDASANFTAYLQGFAAGLKRTQEATLAAAELEPEKISKLVLNNYNLSIVRLFRSQLGIPIERMYLRNIARFAHAIASDNLINLSDHVAAEGTLEHEHSLLLSAGPVMWGGAVLRSNVTRTKDQ